MRRARSAHEQMGFTHPIHDRAGERVYRLDRGDDLDAGLSSGRVDEAEAQKEQSDDAKPPRNERWLSQYPVSCVAVGGAWSGLNSYVRPIAIPVT